MKFVCEELVNKIHEQGKALTLAKADEARARLAAGAANEVWAAADRRLTAESSKMAALMTELQKEAMK